MFPQPDIIRANGQRARLDESLGDGFALLQISDGPHDGFREFVQPVWRRIGARKILALPGGLTFAADGSDKVIGDFGDALQSAFGATRMTALIRPDRYVCAVMRPGEAESVARRLEALAPKVANSVPP